MKFCCMNCVWKYNKQNPNHGCWKKGQAPPNKGKKGIHLSRATEFKKGQVGITHLGIGSERKHIDKNGIVRRFIKIAEPAIWAYYAIYLWEYCFGPIPVGFLLHHIDSNPLHDVIDNLALVTRAEHINLHRDKLQDRKHYHARAKAKYNKLYGNNPAYVAIAERRVQKEKGLI